MQELKERDEGGCARLGFLYQERLCRDRPPKVSHTPAVDTDHTKCIHSDSTVAREARAMPNRGHTAHHFHRKS